MDNKHTEDYVLVLEGRTEVQNASEVGKLSIISEFLNEDGSDSPRETIEAIYKREAGDTKPCRQRDRSD